MRKITTAEALAAQIQDGATIAISGNGGGGSRPYSGCY
jgi:propionate CoA-transferase